MKKIWKPLAAFITVMIMAAIMFIGCSDDDPTTPSGNQAPTANAGNNFEHNVTTQGTSFTLNGSGTDTDGTIAGYEWTCTKSPSNSFTFSSETQNPSVSGFTKLGEYEFTLKVKDDKGDWSVGNVVKVTLAKNISTTLNIDAINFSSTPGTQLNFTPSYSNVSNASNFTTTDINNCLTYKIEVVNHDGSFKHTWDSTDTSFTGIILPRSEYGTDLATFTQTFYNNGQEKGTRVLKVMTADGKFQYFGVGYAPTGSVLAINTVSISKKVTSGDL